MITFGNNRVYYYFRLLILVQYINRNNLVILWLLIIQKLKLSTMRHIDKNKPVMVTGATGYVAGWIVKRLLDEGLTVHAPIRHPENIESLLFLNNLAAQSKGTIRYFKADLLK